MRLATHACCTKNEAGSNEFDSTDRFLDDQWHRDDDFECSWVGWASDLGPRGLKRPGVFHDNQGLKTRGAIGRPQNRPWFCCGGLGRLPIKVEVVPVPGASAPVPGASAPVPGASAPVLTIECLFLH